MMSKLPDDRKWQNKRFLSTLNKLVEDGDITKTKQTFKLSVQYKKRMEKKGKKVKKASPLKKTKNVAASSTINHVLVGGSANNTPGIATVSTGYITNNDPPKQKVPLNEMPTKQCSLCLKNKKKWSFTVGEWDKVGERQCQVCTKAAAKETSAASSVGNASMTTSNTQSSAPVSSSTKWSSMSLSKDINENPLQLYQTQLTIHGSTLVAVNLQRCCEFISLPIIEVQRYEIFYQVARYPNEMVPVQMIYLRPGTFLLPHCSDEQTIQGYVYVISTHHIGNINDNFDV